MNEIRPGRFTILPVIVKNLLIINGIFFLATLALERLNIDLRDVLGLHIWGSDEFKPYQLVTYMFMHGDFRHILFNMLAIWFLGYMIENFWGPKRFLTYYLITGFGAAIVHYAIMYFEIRPVIEVVETYINNPDHAQFIKFLDSPYFVVASYEIQDIYAAFREQYNSIIHTDPSRALALSVEFMETYKVEYLNALPPIVGASGALFGILLAFGIMFPNSKIYIYFLFPIKAKYLVIGYGLLELFSGISNNPNDNVAHFAHLGGMVFGFIMLKIWNVKRLN